MSNSRLIGGAFMGGEEGLKRGGKAPLAPANGTRPATRLLPGLGRRRHWSRDAYALAGSGPRHLHAHHGEHMPAAAQPDRAVGFPARLISCASAAGLPYPTAIGRRTLRGNDSRTSG